MRARWLILVAVLVIAALAAMSVRASRASAPEAWARLSAPAEAPLTVYSEDGARTPPLALGEVHEDGSGAVATGAASATDTGPGPTGRSGVASHDGASSLSVLESAGVTSTPRQGASSQAIASSEATDHGNDLLDAAAAQGAACAALSAGQSGGGPLVRATVVRTAAGVANIYNSAVAVGFMFDPNDNAKHRLQFSGPQVSQSEFSLHGSAASAVTIDGQAAVPGQWYALHAGLTITASRPVGIHVRPAAPHSNG